jgi:hypothetical protein
VGSFKDRFVVHARAMLAYLAARQLSRRARRCDQRLILGGSTMFRSRLRIFADAKRAGALSVAVVTGLTGLVFAAPPAAAAGETVWIAGAPAIENGPGHFFNLKYGVWLSDPRPTTTKVYFTTQDDTAVAGSDYIAKTGYVSIAAGQTETVFNIKGIGDAVPEPSPERFFVLLTGATGGVTVDPDQSSDRAMIIDDDPTNAATISIGDTALHEGNSGTQTASVAISLSAPVLTDTSITYQTASGTATAPADYKSKTLTTKIPAGRTSITATALVYGNTAPEPNRQFYIDVVAGGVPIARTRGTITIIDDEGASPGVSIGNSTLVEGDQGKKNLVFTLTLNAPSATDVNIIWCSPSDTAAAGLDYKAKCTGTVKIRANTTTAKIVIPVYGETLDEGNESFEVELWSTSGSGIPIVDGTGVGTIINDDTGFTCLDSSVIGNSDHLFTGELGVYGNAPGLDSDDGTCNGGVFHVFTVVAASDLAAAATACQNLGQVVLAPSASDQGYPVPTDWWFCT